MIFNESGGTSLNFKVIGGITEPSNPKENTIWVNTDVEITSYVFSASDPFVGSIVENSGTVLGTIAGRTFTKVNAKKAVWAFVCANGFTGPMLVSTDKNACVYSTSGDHSSTITTDKTIVYNGVTYFYSSGSWMGGNHTDEISPSLVASSEQEAALLLARTYSPEGTAWIATGTESKVSFNALKKDGIQVCPISVKQHIGGSLVDKTAKSYQGGAWVDWWRGELYKDGKLYNVLANGFETTGTTVVEYKNGYFIYYDSGSGGCITSPEKLNTTGYKTIKITGGLTYQSSGITYFKAGLAKSKNTTSFVSSVQFPNNSTTQTISINIPSDGGNYYLVLACGGSTSTTNCVKITKIIME